VQSSQGAGFYVGTSSNLNTLIQNGQAVYTQSALTIGSGSFSAAVGSLNENTTYYYVAFMEALIDGAFREVYGSVKSFRTLSASTVTTLNRDWLEAPESPASLGGKYLVTTRGTLNGRNVRNYSILYDPSRYASLWTAYVYCDAYHGSGNGSGWKKNPLIPENKQADCTRTYPSVDGVTYDRGHQIPNADRNADNSLQSQTYYWTNSTPQHASFNQGIWNSLENQVRSIGAATDSVYVVTGPVYQTVGGSETVRTFRNSSNDDKVLPIPNYYFKVLLKVKRSGGSVTSASAIGFWFTHEAHSGENWQNFAVSVDEIERKTGFNFFANLPPSIESSAEANSNWNTFRNF